jgi:hypothetical protein
MIEVNYEFFQEIFEGIWEKTNLNKFIWGLKGICIAFLILRYLFIVMKSKAAVSEIQSSVATKLPISTWNLGYYFFIAICVASYDKVMLGMDNILGYFVFYFSELDTTTTTMNMEAQTESVPVDASALEALKIAALEMMKVITNPFLWTLAILKGIVWIFDICVYGIFIGERFFVLLILKITGPAVLTLSLVPKFGGMVGKWLSLYMRWYLLIIPYFIVNLVVNGFLEAYDVLFSEFGTNAGTSLAIDIIKTQLKIPLFIMLAILKFKLYSSAKGMYNEMIDINIKDDD